MKLNKNGDRYFRGLDPSGVPGSPPYLFMTDGEYHDVMHFVPHYEAAVRGPVPLGGTEPIVMVVGPIMASCTDAALLAIDARLRVFCEASDFDYDPADWTLVKLGGRYVS